MGQALIARGGGVGGSAKAKVQVIAPLGSTLTISQGDVVFTRDVEVSPVEMSLGYGVWTISASGAATKTIEIDVLKVYEVNVRDVTYGISIDMSNGDPAAAVTYTDDAVGYSALSCDSSTGACNYGSWEGAITGVIGCKPCLYKDGARVNYLNPNNYAQFEDGSAADITSGNAGEVMVEFKKTWYKYAVSENVLTFQIANYDRSADGFVCSAFKSNDGTATVKDFMYFGAYEGYSKGGDDKCHSLSGKSVWNDENWWSYSDFRTKCKNFGASYGMEDWVKRYYILGLLMLVTKTRGIQAAIGDGNLESGDLMNSGTMDTRGLFYGVNDGGNTGVKAFGIEHLWGNTYSWCDGIITLSESTVGIKECAPYNDSGEGYTEVACAVSGSGGYPTSMATALNGAVVLASASQSDAAQGWCDYVYVYDGSGYVAYVGGVYLDDVDYGGPFYAYFNYGPGSVDDYYVGRLVSA